MKKLMILALSVFTVISVEAQSWELSKEKNGIKVYTKSSPDYSMPASKVVATFDASFDKVVNAIYDVTNYKDYVPDCDHTKVLKTNGSNELIYYGLYNAPWPASDRDLVIQLKKKNIANGVQIDMVNKPDYIAHKDNATRIPIYDGYWKIEKVNGKVKITLEYQTDPGGNVPDWMVQGAATKTPFNMVENLIAFVK